MSRKKMKSGQHGRQQTPLQSAPKPGRVSKAVFALKLALIVIMLAAIGGFAYLGATTKRKPAVITSNTAPKRSAVTAPGIAGISSFVSTANVKRKAKSLDDLLAMSPEQLAGVDIAEMNLLCATGLPGAEGLNVDHSLAMLDQWAARVKFETNRHLYRVIDPRHADHYRHSEAYFRAEFLLQVLQQDLGVKYDMTAVGNFDFNDSRMAFIHGMIPAPGQTISDTPGGTCTSMPIMYVAVGRRLGYPLKLVTTDAHIFVRWDGKNHSNPAWRERFNIEGTNGFHSFDDDYHKTWPLKVTAQQVHANRYLVSLTRIEELAEFLAARGHCGQDNGRIAFAARCFENAYRCDPSRPAYRNWFLRAAVRSEYRPATPALRRLLAQRTRGATGHPTRTNLLDIPIPSEMGTASASLLPGTPPRIGQVPQLKMPHVVQPHIPRLGLQQPYQPYSGQPPRQ